MKMLITYISFQCEDVDAECVKGVCIYMGEDPDNLIREYVVSTWGILFYFLGEWGGDFHQYIILLTCHGLSNMTFILFIYVFFTGHG